MKKFLSIYLIFFFQLLFGQNNYPTIHQINPNNLTFNNLTVEANGIYINTNVACPRNDQNDYKGYYYFKAENNIDLNLTVKANNTSNPDFKLFVWKIIDEDRNEYPNELFKSNQTINANRSIYGGQIEKGLFETEAENHNCEFYNGDGKVRGLISNDIVRKNEIVVIAFMTTNQSDTFDLTLNIAESRTISSFSNLCHGDSYTFDQIIDEIQINSRLSDIQLYRNNSFNENDRINAGEFFTSDTTIYAQVRDQNGVLKYIYTIPLRFVPEHNFVFRTDIQSGYFCDSVYHIPTEAELLAMLFSENSLNAGYSIEAVTINGINYNLGEAVNLTGNTVMTLNVHYGGLCPVDSQVISIPIIKNKPNLSNPISDTTCERVYKIDFVNISNKLGINLSDYDLFVKKDGISISNGAEFSIESNLEYKVSIKSKTEGNCESNVIDFTVTKTQKANIIDEVIEDICLEDFIESGKGDSNTYIKDAIEKIKYGNSYTLKYYKADGSKITMDQIYDYMKETLVGKVIVKALSDDNEGICDTEVELKFNINASSFERVDNIAPLLSNCVEVNSSYTFGKSQIEAYLRSQLSGNIEEFSGFESVELTSANPTKEITFKVRLAGETCWSDEMKLVLKINYQPNFTSEPDPQFHCEGDQIMFDYNYLKGIFVDEIENYSVKINEREIGFSEILNFGSSSTKNYSLTITNPSTGCSATVNLIIKKKNDIPDIYKNRPPYKVSFCQGDGESIVKQKIQAIKDEINDENQFTTELTPTQIYDKYVAGSSNLVEVDFENNNFCGVLKVIFEFEKLDVPIIKIPEIDPVCSVYYFDIKEIDDYEKYDFILKDRQGNSIPDTNFTYDLPIGHYALEVRFKGSQCMSEFPIEIKAAAKPIIEKIVISNNQIIVQAKGEGKLEYSFDGDDYNLINKRTLNEDQLNKPITVSVRLNDCEVTEIVYVLKVPQVFTPNGDQYNNQWAEGLADKTTEYHIQIFDRYGKIIYENQGAGVLKWDGTNNGKQIPTDTYWYLIKPLKADTMLQVQYSGSILVKQKK